MARMAGKSTIHGRFGVLSSALLVAAGMLLRPCGAIGTIPGSCLRFSANPMPCCRAAETSLAVRTPPCCRADRDGEGSGPLVPASGPTAPERTAPPTIAAASLDHPPISPVFSCAFFGTDGSPPLPPLLRTSLLRI